MLLARILMGLLLPVGIPASAPAVGEPRANGGSSAIVDNIGHVYLAGTTLSTGGIATVGAFQDTLFGGSDAFLAKFGATASRPSFTNVSTSNVKNIIQIFPNPTFGSISVASDMDGNISVHTIDGREILTQNINQDTISLHLPPTLATGLYMLRFKGDDGSTQVVRLVYEP